MPSHPPIYELLWGCRAHAKTTKKKIMDVLFMINDTIPISISSLHNNALGDVFDRVRRRAAAGPGNVANANVHPSSSCI